MLDVICKWSLYCRITVLLVWRQNSVECILWEKCGSRLCTKLKRNVLASLKQCLVPFRDLMHELIREHVETHCYNIIYLKLHVVYRPYIYIYTILCSCFSGLSFASREVIKLFKGPPLSPCAYNCTGVTGLCDSHHLQWDSTASFT